MKWTCFTRGLPVLLLFILFGCAACAPGSVMPATSRGPSPTSMASHASRIHHVTPGSFALFARITFTADTSFDQAVAILGGRVYPWTCDAPRSPTPPPDADQRASFAATHTLLISYAGWNELEAIAASPHVTSVDGVALYQCS